MTFSIQARNQFVRALAVIGLIFLYDRHSVRAGAWNEPAGQGLAILDATVSGGSRYFERSGAIAPVDRFQRSDATAYVEYGVTDWLMAVVHPDLTAISLDGGRGGRYRGLGTSDIGAQVRLLLYGPAVFAAAATFRAPGSTDRRDPALIGQTAHEGDLRALFGLGFTVYGWPAFLDAQAGYRVRDGHAPDEVHADLTLGVRPWLPLMLLLQGFNTTAIGRGTPWFPHEEYTHIEVSAVYDLDALWSVQAGVYTTVLGRQSLREQGAVLAVWRRF